MTLEVVSVVVAPSELVSDIAKPVVTVCPAATSCCVGVNTKLSTAALTAVAVPVIVKMPFLIAPPSVAALGSDSLPFDVLLGVIVIVSVGAPPFGTEIETPENGFRER